MSDARPPGESLGRMLQIEERGGGAFAASLESFWGATAPGDLLARALLAASAGRDDAPAALHASFLAHAGPDEPLSLTREELDAGVTRVRARARGALICDATFRFAPRGDGFGYQCLAPDRGLPAPEDLPSEVEQGRAEGWAQYAVGPIESRRISAPAPVKDDEPSLWQGWLRPRESLRGDTQLHAAALVFLSEYRSHWAVERRLGADFPRASIELLDHSLWIHRAEPWTDWWLADTRSDVGVGGRCFSRREIYTRRGALVASAAWEARVEIAAR